MVMYMYVNRMENHAVVLCARDKSTVESKNIEVKFRIGPLEISGVK